MKRLRAVANGRTATRTRPKRDTTDADGWTASEAKRLAAMQRHGLDAKTMAKMLGRSVKDIRTKLAADLKL